MESGIGLAGGCGGNGGVALILVYEGRRCNNGYGFDGGGDFGACDGKAVAAAASGTKPDAILAPAADAVLTGGEVLCGSELDFSQVLLVVASWQLRLGCVSASAPGPAHAQILASERW